MFTRVYSGLGFIRVYAGLHVFTRVYIRICACLRVLAVFETILLAHETCRRCERQKTLANAQVILDVVAQNKSRTYRAKRFKMSTFALCELA